MNSTTSQKTFFSVIKDGLDELNNKVTLIHRIQINFTF